MSSPVNVETPPWLFREEMLDRFRVYHRTIWISPSTWQVHACSPQVTNVTHRFAFVHCGIFFRVWLSPWDIHWLLFPCNALWSCFVISRNTPDQLGDHTNKGFFPPCDLVKCTESKKCMIKSQALETWFGVCLFVFGSFVCVCFFETVLMLFVSIIYAGVSGRVELDSNGDRIGDYWLWSMPENEEKYALWGEVQMTAKLAGNAEVCKMCIRRTHSARFFLKRRT